MLEEIEREALVPLLSIQPLVTQWQMNKTIARRNSIRLLSFIHKQLFSRGAERSFEGNLSAMLRLRDHVNRPNVLCENRHQRDHLSRCRLFIRSNKMFQFSSSHDWQLRVIFLSEKHDLIVRRNNNIKKNFIYFPLFFFRQ